MSDAAGVVTDAGIRALLQPRSVALIGVSDDPKKFAGSPVRVAKESGFTGPIYPVNPARGTIGDLRAYGAVTEIEGEVDLALIVVPRNAVHAALEQCGRKGVKAAVVLTSGFADAGESGARMQDELAALARQYGMRVVGPNCTGCFSGAAQLPLGTSAAFSTGRYRSGAIGLITQSGAIGTALLALAAARELGPRFWFSTGNEMDLTVADFLEAGLSDPLVRVFCLYLETIRDVPRFARATRAALRRGVPVVALKVGTSTLGAEKAQAHTGAMIGSDHVYSGFFAQHGVIRAHSIDDLLPIAEVFQSPRPWGQGRIGAISISGALAAYMADRMLEEKLEFADLGADTLARLAATSEYASAGNPFDPSGIVISKPQIFVDTLDAFLADPQVDVLVVVVSFAVHMVRIVPPLIIDAARQSGKLICVVRWMPDDYGNEPFAPMRALGIPVFNSVDECVRALGARRRWELARQAAADADAPTASRHIAADAAPLALPAPELAHPRALLETEARALLARHGIGAPQEVVAATAEEAIAGAARIGYPVVLKVLSRDILHKTEAGGVLLDIGDAAQLRAAHARLLDNVRTRLPAARIEGVLVQRMAQGGIDVILGARHEPGFGPALMVGVGGVLAEAIGRVAVRPLPLTRADAEAMIEEAGLAPLLASARHGRPYDRPALVAAILGLARLLGDHGAAIDELDVNPLRVLHAGEGVLALDALMVARVPGMPQPQPPSGK